MLEIIKGVFNRNSEFLQGDDTMIEKARKLMVQMVNALTVKQETGGPLASLYLLGNPDHYTNFSFKAFFWNSYVNEVKSSWAEENDTANQQPTKVIIGKVKGNMVAISPILDYTLRPKQYEDMTLYDWIRVAEKYKIPKKKIPKDKKKMKADDLDLGSTASFSDNDKENDNMEIDSNENEDVNMLDLTQKTLVDEQEEDDGYSTDSTLIANDDGDSDYEEEEISSDSESDSEEDDEIHKSSHIQKKLYPQFLPDHPHHDTHSVKAIMMIIV
ncbi:hypothetical protein EVG20_g10676 [Dentipellis fragilis]|uniref:Uncharacterized protein n=1 Tax=Dentipellis fragilis TaxID=205917 RepID=A0A4Y9XRZ9_9AGAM|nr:hypothetical protein EVG20_g10676 [Dentipellis fragilis]